MSTTQSSGTPLKQEEKIIIDIKRRKKEGEDGAKEKEPEAVHGEPKHHQRE